MRIKKTKRIFVLGSLIFIYINSLAATTTTINNANTSEAEDFIDEVYDTVAEFQGACVAEGVASNKASLMSFNYNTVNIEVSNMTTFVPSFSIVGSGSQEMDATTSPGIIKGRWILPGTSMAQYVAPDVMIYDAYASHITIDYVSTPASPACPATPPMPCPNAWTAFTTAMYSGSSSIASAVNSRSASPALTMPTYTVNCTALAPVTADLGVIGDPMADFVEVPLPVVTATTPLRTFKKF